MMMRPHEQATRRRRLSVKRSVYEKCLYTARSGMAGKKSGYRTRTLNASTIATIPDESSEQYFFS